MATWLFGDGFDCYQQFSDAYLSGTYWDSSSGAGLPVLSTAGRLTGSRGLFSAGGSSFTSTALTKSSGQNDAVHHINVAYNTATALSGTAAGFYIILFDGTTAQCMILFRSDGAILLYSGASTTTLLATYTGGVPASNTWYGYEIEVVINNTTGSFKVRRNGNTSDDFSATGLNTRVTANNYANKLSLGYGSGAINCMIDDFLWRSEASAVAWVGDVRCYTRMPASDAAAVWTRSGSVVPVVPFSQGSTGSVVSGTARYAPFIATCDGTVGTATISLNAGFTGNMKCSLFNDSSGAPGTVLGSATPIANPAAGNNTFTFGSPPAVTRGTKYWIGFDSDAAGTAAYNLTVSTSNNALAYGNSGVSSNTVYASFPTAAPSLSQTGLACPIFTANITPTTAANANLVSEVAQDGAAGYVLSSNIGDTDLYNLQAIAGTPSSTIALTTRAYAQKSDAGTRNIGVQLKSGSTTSSGPSAALNTSFGWFYRTDAVDPATAAAWTATGVNNLQVGVKVTA